MPTDERCSGCPLCDVGEPTKSIDRLDSKFLVVTDTPSHFSANSGKLLSKSATTIFARTLSAAGFGKDDFSYHPAIRCPHDPNLYDTKQKTAIREHCRPFLLEKMEELDPEVVIPLGAEAARQVLNKAVKITKIRGVLNEGGERLVFPMLNPSMVAMYPQHQTTFTTDVSTLKALHDTGYNVSEVSDSKTGNYELIDDLQFLVSAKPEVLFFDTETTGLQFFKEGPDDVRDYVHGESTKTFDPSAAVLTMQFCYEPGKAYMLVWDHPEMPMTRRRQNVVRAQLRKLLTNPNTKVIGFNSKYDKTYVKSTIGVDYRIGGDAQMLAVLLDENAIEKNQNILVKRYVPEMAGYDDYFNATYNKARMWEVPVDEILVYGCGDVDSGLRLYNALFKEVQADPKLLAHYNRVSVPGLNALSSIEMEGLYVSEEAIDLLETEVEGVVKEQYDALIEQVPRAIKRLHVEKGLSFTRSEFLLDILFRHKSGLRLRPKVFTDTTKNLSPERRVPSVSTKQHLPYFFEDYPFVVDLAEHIKISRLLSANIKGFKKKYIINNRVRPTYSLAKTVTGRTACIKGDTPVVTSKGLVLAQDVAVGDEVWTHLGRWMPVTNLYLKPITGMYRVSFSNGEVLTCTAEHRVLLESGAWATIKHLMLIGDLHAEREQETPKGSHTNPQSGYGLQAVNEDCTGSSGRVWGESPYSKSDDTEVRDGRGLQEVCTLQVQDEQAGGKEPSVWESLGIRVRGWEGVPNAASGWSQVLCASDSFCGVSRSTSKSVTGGCSDTSHRRKSFEQQHRQFGDDHECGAQNNPREIPTAFRGFDIEKIEYAGSHRVYDFEVAEDHSYLACGVFSHNSQDPNGQNFPKRGKLAKAYRRIYVAPEGYYVLEADLSQAELRIAAMMANEPTMLRIYREGGDIHKETAYIVMGVTAAQFADLPKEEQSLARFKAKAVNFGFLYGMGYRKFIIYAKTQYGVDFTEEEAQRIRAGFFRKYSALEAWHKKMRAYAHEHGFVRSLSGRKRHLPMIYSEDEGVAAEAGRQAINSPVQEFGSSLGVMAMGRLTAEIDPRYLRPVAFVHDAIYCLVPKQYLDWGARTLKWYMETNPVKKWFGVDLTCPIIADVGFGENFGDTFELGGIKIDEEYDFSVFFEENVEEGEKSIHVPEQEYPENDGILVPA